MAKDSSGRFGNVRAAGSQSLSGSLGASNGESEVKHQLFDQMKKSGVLDSLKSQLRKNLFE